MALKIKRTAEVSVSRKRYEMLVANQIQKELAEDGEHYKTVKIGWMGEAMIITLQSEEER